MQEKVGGWGPAPLPDAMCLMARTTFLFGGGGEGEVR